MQRLINALVSFFILSILYCCEQGGNSNSKNINLSNGVEQHVLTQTQGLLLSEPTGPIEILVFYNSYPSSFIDDLIDVFPNAQIINLRNRISSEDVKKLAENSDYLNNYIQDAVGERLILDSTVDRFQLFESVLDSLSIKLMRDSDSNNFILNDSAYRSVTNAIEFAANAYYNKRVSYFFTPCSQHGRNSESTVFLQDKYAVTEWNDTLLFYESSYFKHELDRCLIRKRLEDTLKNLGFRFHDPIDDNIFPDMGNTLAIGKNLLIGPGDVVCAGQKKCDVLSEIESFFAPYQVHVAGANAHSSDELIQPIYHLDVFMSFVGFGKDSLPIFLYGSAKEFADIGVQRSVKLQRDLTYFRERYIESAFLIDLGVDSVLLIETPCLRWEADTIAYWSYTNCLIERDAESIHIVFPSYRVSTTVTLPYHLQNSTMQDMEMRFKDSLINTLSHHFENVIVDFIDMPGQAKEGSLHCLGKVLKRRSVSGSRP